MKHKTLQELNLLDNFLFEEALNQGENSIEFCRILLSTILGKNFKNIKITPQRTVPGTVPGKHGIRMDAYIEADEYNDTTPDSTENATNTNLQNMQNMIKQIKENGEVGVRYMQSWEYEAYIREESKEIGLAEGKTIGEHTKAIEIAKNLLDVLDPATIALKTGLTEDEVNALLED